MPRIRSNVAPGTRAASTSPSLLLLLLLTAACGGPRVMLPPPSLDPAEPAGEFRFHTVEKSTTFASLARHLLRDEAWREALALTNGLAPASPLGPGDRIVLPAGAPERGRHGDEMAARAVASAGEKALVEYDRGTLLAQEGRDAAAVVHFERAVDLAPGMAEARYNAGVSQLRAADAALGADEAAGMRAVARESLRWAAFLRPGDAAFRRAYGVALMKSGALADAEVELQAALMINPEDAESRFTLARLYERMGRTEDARREWRRYLEQDDQGPWAAEARARLEALDR